jgi:hypothetical protein
MSGRVAWAQGRSPAIGIARFLRILGFLATPPRIACHLATQFAVAACTTWVRRDRNSDGHYFLLNITLGGAHLPATRKRKDKIGWVKAVSTRERHRL